MPGHATAAITIGAGRLDRRVDGGVDGPVLVVLRDPLHQPLRLGREHDERPYEVEEARRLEDAADEDLQCGAVGDDLAAVDRLPRCEVLPAGGEGAHRGTAAVGDDGHGVGHEDRRDVTAVGLALVPGAAQGGVLGAGVLQLQQAERDAVDEDDDIRAPVPAGLDDGELVDREPVVRSRMRPVDEPDQGGTHRPVRGPVLDRHPLDEEPVHAFVLGEHVLRLGAQQSSDRPEVLQRRLLDDALGDPASHRAASNIDVRTPTS